MPRGANPQRESEYRKLERKFEKEHRYPGREEEVAARIVNKQRRLAGETKEQRAKDAHGKTPEPNLPIAGFQKMTIRAVERKMESLSPAELRKIRSYETHHKNRKGLLSKIDRQLAAH